MSYSLVWKQLASHSLKRKLVQSIQMRQRAAEQALALSLPTTIDAEMVLSETQSAGVSAAEPLLNPGPSLKSHRDQYFDALAPGVQGNIASRSVSIAPTVEAAAISHYDQHWPAAQVDMVQYAPPVQPAYGHEMYMHDPAAAYADLSHMLEPDQALLFCYPGFNYAVFPY